MWGAWPATQRQVPKLTGGRFPLLPRNRMAETGHGHCFDCLGSCQPVMVINSAQVHGISHLVDPLQRAAEVERHSKNMLKDKLVTFASDTASVMLGKPSVVAKLLKDTFPNLIPSHCTGWSCQSKIQSATGKVSTTSKFSWTNCIACTAALQRTAEKSKAVQRT